VLASNERCTWEIRDGFIKPDDGGADVFVHITAVQRSGLQGLAEGQTIAYELRPQRNGKMAAEDLQPTD